MTGRYPAVHPVGVSRVCARHGLFGLELFYKAVPPTQRHESKKPFENARAGINSAREYILAALLLLPLSGILLSLEQIKLLDYLHHSRFRTFQRERNLRDAGAVSNMNSTVYLRNDNPCHRNMIRKSRHTSEKLKKQRANPDIRPLLHQSIYFSMENSARRTCWRATV